jgi:hypothetical protein
VLSVLLRETISGGEDDPGSWEPPLVKMLTDADAAGAAEGKYQVTISGSQGTQAGDHNVQVNRFGA